MSQPELKPCPFCGEQAEIRPWHGGGSRRRMVSCSNELCCVSPQVVKDAPEDAAIAWNTRPGERALQQQIDDDLQPSLFEEETQLEDVEEKVRQLEDAVRQLVAVEFSNDLELERMSADGTEVEPCDPGCEHCRILALPAVIDAMAKRPAT